MLPSLPENLAGDKVLSRKQLVELLGCSLNSVKRMADAGSGPPVLRLSPRRVGYRVRDVISWLEESKRACGLPQ